MLNFICASIRNKLLLVTGFGTAVMLAVIAWCGYSFWQNDQIFIEALGVYISSDEELGMLAASFKERGALVMQIGFVSLMVAIAISFIMFMLMVQKNLVAPARKLMREIAAMAEGDFTGHVSVTSKDEIGQIASSAAMLKMMWATLYKALTSRYLSYPSQLKKWPM